ncbi:PREDICTED: melanoma-associated antigen 10-like [Dipodomys ordii]|uniref:Melanoma-associated antigen 10-like n=1 Tax=Dipodomys ordii TaxID=10020 RepID=A0A1S3G2B1_DIPOR|nr:PREDICTED: melanoma-associated antigen 10-like [Dipodomys ordii]
MPYTQRILPSELERGLVAQSQATGLVDEEEARDSTPTTLLFRFLAEMSVTFLLNEVIGAANEDDQEPHNQEREDVHPDDDEILQNALQKEALALVRYLLRQYNSCQPVTDVDMLSRITGGYRPHFPVILDKACICMQLLFGIDVKEVDTLFHTHVLVIAAGITYDGVLSHVQGMPKTGLLIIVLCIIFTEGGCATEEAIWQVLDKMEVYPDSEHVIFGIPRKLLMEDFVYEQYLEYHQVPGSDPIAYEFRWGPRAYAETTQRKVLEHWAKYSGIDPSSIPTLYEEALQEEQGANTNDSTSLIKE